jgi:hypothetical protein
MMKFGVNGVFRQKRLPSRHGRPGGDTHGKGGSGAGIKPALLSVIGFGLEGPGFAERLLCVWPAARAVLEQLP